MGEICYRICYQVGTVVILTANLDQCMLKLNQTNSFRKRPFFSLCLWDSDRVSSVFSLSIQKDQSLNKQSSVNLKSKQSSFNTSQIFDQSRSFELLCDLFSVRLWLAFKFYFFRSAATLSLQIFSSFLLLLFSTFLKLRIIQKQSSYISISTQLSLFIFIFCFFGFSYQQQLLKHQKIPLNIISPPRMAHPAHFKTQHPFIFIFYQLLE